MTVDVYDVEDMLSSILSNELNTVVDDGSLQMVKYHLVYVQAFANLFSPFS